MPLSPARKPPRGAKLFSVRVTVTEEPISLLAEHATVSAAFRVGKILEFNEVDDNLVVSERLLDVPHWKDYDALEGPAAWADRFDVSNWGLLGALLDGRRVGGAVIAFDTAAVQMLEGRKDLAVLWDLRVQPDCRRRGVGAALFRAVEHWAASKGCTELKIETQNTNLAACRFYERQGCDLREINPDAYPTLPDELQLIWSKTPRAL
jgi:GNAT superfamily N-acetyltransferase